jgi:heptosyltransferase-2
MPRTLLIKFGAIGDVVMAIPGARQLHDSGYTVDWVCGPVVLPLLQLYPWINPILADDRAILKGSAGARMTAIAALWRKLAGRHYDVAATLYYDPRYRVLALPVRARRKLMLSHTERSRCLLPGRHHTDEYARILLGRPDGLEPMQLAPVEPARELLPSTPLPRSPRLRVVLAPAGARNLMNDDALRRWPAEHYVTLAQSLQSRGMEVVLIGGAEDAWVQPLFSAKGCVDLIGRLSLPETLALLDEADLLVTHDTGPLHLGGITRTSVLGLFGPTDPRGRLPQRAGTAAIWGGEGFACRPCYDGRSFAPCPANECLSRVLPDMVLAVAAKMLDDRAQGCLAPPQIVTPESTVAARNLRLPGAPILNSAGAPS